MIAQKAAQEAAAKRAAATEVQNVAELLLLFCSIAMRLRCRPQKIVSYGETSGQEGTDERDHRQGKRAQGARGAAFLNVFVALGSNAIRSGDDSEARRRDAKIRCGS